MLTGKTILVTGGTGAFGRAFVRHALTANPESIRVLSRNEHHQAQMAHGINDRRVRYFIGDVRDRHRVQLAMRGVDIVIHAAALKRIEKCQYDPMEAMLTNVVGTQMVVEAALESKIQRLVFISSDKATAPITIYGYTKGTAERLVLAANSYLGGPPLFSAVRYGNVANSTGSVIPLWRQQVRSNVPLTITDPDMTRYWIELPEAVEFVVKSLTLPAGRVYVPRMPSFKLSDLADAIAPDGYPRTVVGLRGIEKLHEDIVAPWEQDVVGMDPGSRSDNNDWWLSIEDLKYRLERL